MNLEDYYLLSDTILVKERQEGRKTDAGIILPPGMALAHITSGFVVLRGPGLPFSVEDDSVTNERKAVVLPLTVNTGDEVFFYCGDAKAVLVENEPLFLLRQAAVLFAKHGGI